MDPGVFTKQSWEQRTLSFDASPSLASGDSLASISGITVWEGTTEKTTDMVQGIPSLSGNTVLAVIKGGTDQHSYWVRVRLVTTVGDKIEDDLRLLVRDMGG